jgi:hypothetical protein
MTRLVRGIVALGCFLLVHVQATQGAVIVMSNGDLVNCTIPEMQSITVQTGSGDRVATIARILWLVGRQTKTIALRDQGGHLTGRVDSQQIKFNDRSRDRSVYLDEILFLYSSDLPVDVAVSDLWEFVEHDHGVAISRVPVAARPPGNVNIRLYASNWNGQVTLSRVRVPENITSGKEFDLQVDVLSGPPYDNLAQKAVEPGSDLCLKYFFHYTNEKDKSQGGLIQASIPLKYYAEKGMLPASRSKKTTLRLSLTIGGGFLGVYEGKGQLYLYLGPGGPGDKSGPVSAVRWGRGETVGGGSGNVEVVSTASNILEVPLTVVKE